MTHVLVYFFNSVSIRAPHFGSVPSLIVALVVVNHETRLNMKRILVFLNLIIYINLLKFNHGFYILFN